jgi:Na+-transporting methylmalonyl-CoA/oxaloacetate decarboxylase gamma subunit
VILFTALVFCALPIAAVVVVVMGHAPPRAATRPHRPPRRIAQTRPQATTQNRNRPDRLAEAVQAWLDDDRPAWETIDALEHDVQLALEGRSDAAERMARHPGAIVV